MKISTLIPEFTDSIPTSRQEGVLYISITSRLAVHNCCCGCGMKVITPIRPTQWCMSYNGESISLFPSIGNWSFACKSHYWIKESAVVSSYTMDDDEIAKVREQGRLDNERHYSPTRSNDENNEKVITPRKSWLRRFFDWLFA